MSNDFGLCCVGFGHPWYLGYTAKGKLRWLPYPLKRAIVVTWNRAICLFNGHIGLSDELTDGHGVKCVHCWCK